MASQTSPGSHQPKQTTKKQPKRVEVAIKGVSKLRQENANIINALLAFGRENSQHAELIKEILSRPLQI